MGKGGDGVVGGMFLLLRKVVEAEGWDAGIYGVQCMRAFGY
jgi:hypothetical protein